MWTDLFSQSVLELSEVGSLSSIRDRWWPTPWECPRAAPRDLAPPAPVTLDLRHMSLPFISLAAAMLITLMLVFLEIASHKSIASMPNYLKQKMVRGSECNGAVTEVRVTHVATQTVLWAASRAGSPSTDFPQRLNLSHKLYTSDGQLARI